MIELSPKWAIEPASKPETGMGYQVVSIILKDGRKFDQVAVVEGRITEIPGRKDIPFSEDQIDRNRRDARQVGLQRRTLNDTRSQRIGKWERYAKVVRFLCFVALLMIANNHSNADAQIAGLPLSEIA